MWDRPNKKDKIKKNCTNILFLNNEDKNDLAGRVNSNRGPGLDDK